jgi:quercetin dioxygenase-like cupin family protein
MSFPVFDYRADIRNLLVTPQIRARFLRMEPGQVASRHSHDLGHEIFLILQGRCIFEIDGAERELGPGELCIALADQPHKVRCTSDEPLVMYLSVTPHVQPTHTGRSPEGERHPTRFMPSSAYDVESDTETPLPGLIERFAAAAEEAARAAGRSAETQREEGVRLAEALAAGDLERADASRERMWEALRDQFTALYRLADLWNDLAPRAGKTG